MIDLSYVKSAADLSTCVTCERKAGALSNLWFIRIELAAKLKGAPHRWVTWAVRCDSESCRQGAKAILKENFGRDLGGYVWRGL